MLRVFSCIARFGFWSLGRVEVVALHAGESQPDVQPALQPEVIAAAVQPLVLRWSLSPGTEVALVLPAVLGGVLSLNAGALHPRTDRAWIETELAGLIPFAPGDIEFEARCVGNGRSIEVAWLPRMAAIEFRTAFARIGLALGEIVFRPQLFAWAERFAAAGHGPDAKGRKLVIEHWDGWCFFHLLAEGCVLRTSASPIRTRGEFADRLQLELLTLEAADQAASRVVLTGTQDRFNKEFEPAVNDAARGIAIERRAADLSGMFLRFWRGGATGIWLVPDDPAPLAMVRRLAFTVAGCGVLLAAAMAWHTSAIREEIAALQAREARLRPQYQTLVAKERQAAAAARTADAVARLAAAPGEPQAALLAVFNALPRSAWVTRFSYENGKTMVAGRGLDTESVIARLKGERGASDIAAAPGDEPEAGNAGAEPRFRVAFQWTPQASARETTGGKAPQ